MAKQRSAKSPNTDHDTSVDDAMSSIELRDAEGNIIDPNAIEVDPDWWDWIQHGHDEEDASASDEA